jgi:chemotaxis protein MotA
MGAFIGLGVAGLSILAAVILKGGSPLMLISIPAFVEVVGGTVGVLMASSGPSAAATLFKLPLSKGTKSPKENRPELIRTLVGFAEKARREGLLALEDDARNAEDPFLQRGVRLVVDGTDPELVKDIMETEMDGIEARHRKKQEIFKNGGAFAPTIGILGTVLSLIKVMMYLDTPEALGPMISSAFLATFYGVGMANVFFYPIANHLKGLTEAEMAEKTLILEGVLSIQSGDNPRVLAEKLWSFLAPGEREGEDEGAGAGAGAREAQAA